MPRQDGVSAAPDVAQHATVLMLTYSDSPEVVSAAVKAGPAATWCTGTSPRTSCCRRCGWPPGHRHLLGPGRGGVVEPDAEQGRPGQPLRTLGARGRRDGPHGRGRRQLEIAGSLFISEKTVKNHINRIFTKLHANNRGHAVSLWLAHH